MAEEFEYRRAPAVPRQINQIDPEKDIRVRLVGRVKEKKEDAVVLEDGSGEAEIVLDSRDVPSDVVRVFARVLPLEDGYELRAELIQDFSGVDTELYKKVMKKDM